MAIAGISLIQIYWFRQAFNTEADQFNREVTSALHQVANRFFELNKAAIPSSNPIRQMSSSYYVVMINNEIDANLLEYLLREEFEKRDIIMDFEYGIYDCTDDKMVYGSYIVVSNDESEPSGELPKWENQAYYFGVNFPKRESTILNRMDVWVFSSLVLLLVVVFFAYSLIAIFRQKRLSEIQKDFINTMTHEFKTPISTIAISANVLKDPAISSQPERLLNYATIIDNENTRMKNQVERVLQLATMDRSELSLKKEEIDVGQLLSTICDRFRIVEENGPVIHLDISESSKIEADRLHLSNVIYNLIDNAIKYSDKNPIIQISVKEDAGMLSISVKDNGIGIPDDQKKKIFQKFYRIPTGNVHDTKGFGLGLSYVQLIANTHGGKVSVSSELTKGSTFTLSLPIK